MDKYAKLEALRAEAKAIIDNTKATAEELKHADELIEQAVALQAEIKEDEARATKMAGLESFMSESQGRKAVTSADEAIKAAKEAKIPAKPKEAEEGFKSFGEQMVAIAAASLPNGFMDRRLKWATGMEAEYKNTPSGLSESSGPDGGFLVQSDFATELMKRTYETGVLVNRCRRIPISSTANRLTWNSIDETTRVNGSRWGGVQAYWTDEADTLTSSKLKLYQNELVLKKLTGLFYATEELLSDSAALGAMSTQAFSEEFGFKIDDAIVNGTGVGQPKGILNDSAVYVSVSKESGQAADTVVAENITKMWARLWNGARRNAVWLINQDVIPQLHLMSLAVGTGGVPVYMPAGGLSGQPFSTLYNRPVLEIEHAATVGDLGDIILTDLSQYLFIDKGAMQSAQSIHVRFLYDEMTFKFTYRCNGMPLWRSSVTPFKGSNTVSPIIVLAARA